jgi:hypothetical protein
MQSGYENPTDEWSCRDEVLGEISDKEFEQTTFHILPALSQINPTDGSRCYMAFRGEAYDESVWTVVPNGWDHEHCCLCWCTIVDGMTYWANDREIDILCDYCHEHYRSQLPAAKVV